MQSIYNIREEFGDILQSLFIFKTTSLRNQMTTKINLEFFDVFIDYFVQRGFFPIIQQQIGMEINNLYIYMPRYPVNCLNEIGQSKIFVNSSINIIGFSQDIGDIQELKQFYKIVNNSQYIFNGQILPNYSDPSQKDIHMYKPQQKYLQLYFSQNNDKLIHLLFESLQRYTTGGIYYQIRYNNIISKSNKNLKYLQQQKQKPVKQRWYIIPKKLTEFLKQLGFEYQYTKDILEQFQIISSIGLIREFFKYLQEGKAKNIIILVRLIKDKLSGFGVDLSGTLDNYKLRILKQLYINLYGKDIFIQNTKTPLDFFDKLNNNQQSMILQKQLDAIIFKQNTTCYHKDLVQTLYKSIQQKDKVYIVKEILEKWWNGQKGKEYIDIKISEESENIQIPLDYLICKSCNQEIICAHICLDIIGKGKGAEQLGTSNKNIGTNALFCKICGQIFKTQLNLQMIEIGEYIDPEKKYSILKTIFRNILNLNIKTIQVFNPYLLFKDMVTTVHPLIKKELIGRKNDYNYKEQKLQVSLVYCCAYFMNIKSDGFYFSMEQFYQFNKKIADSYNDFQKKVQNAQLLINPLFCMQNRESIVMLEKFISKHPFIDNDIKQKGLKYILSQKNKNNELDLRYIYTKKEPNTIQELLLKQATFEVVTDNMIQYSNNKSKFSSQFVSKYIYPNEGNHSRYKPFINEDFSKIFNDILQKTINKSFYIFYKYKCPESLKQNKSEKGHYLEDKGGQKICKYCGINKDNISDDFIKKYWPVFRQQFFDFYRNQTEISKQLSKLEEIQIDFDEKQVITLAGNLQVHLIQLLNIGGFDNLNYDQILKKQNSENLSDKQILKQVLIEKINNYDQGSSLSDNIAKGNSHELKYYSFIEDIQFNWQLFKSRLQRMYYMFITTIYQLGNREYNIDAVKNLNRFFKRCMQSQKNAYIVNQVFLGYFIQQIVPHLINHNNQQQVYAVLQEMIQKDKKLSVNPKEGALIVVVKNQKQQSISNDELQDLTENQQDEEPQQEDNIKDTPDQEQDMDTDLMDRDDGDDE